MLSLMHANSKKVIIKKIILDEILCTIDSTRDTKGLTVNYNGFAQCKIVEI